MTAETRKLSKLIDEVRFNTNCTDTNRFSDARLLLFFNSAQRQIQKIIYNSNPTNSPFQEQVGLTLQNNVSSYELPDDIFAVASVRNVTPINFNGKATVPLKRISEKERNSQRGYYLIKNFIHFAPSTLPAEFSTVAVTYDKALEEIVTATVTIEIPGTCEDFLMAFVERKINYVDSSKDIANSQIFTKEEKEELESMFKEDIKDMC